MACKGCGGSLEQKKLIAVARFYIYRRDYNCYPPEIDSEGTPWWEGDMVRDRQVCGKKYRIGSRYFIIHCRTFKHVAALRGVDKRDLMYMVERFDDWQKNRHLLLSMQDKTEQGHALTVDAWCEMEGGSTS